MWVGHDGALIQGYVRNVQQQMDTNVFFASEGIY